MLLTDSQEIFSGAKCLWCVCTWQLLCFILTIYSDSVAKTTDDVIIIIVYSFRSNSLLLSYIVSIRFTLTAISPNGCTTLYWRMQLPLYYCSPTSTYTLILKVRGAEGKPSSRNQMDLLHQLFQTDLLFHKRSRVTKRNFSDTFRNIVISFYHDFIE